MIKCKEVSTVLMSNLPPYVIINPFSSSSLNQSLHYLSLCFTTTSDTKSTASMFRSSIDIVQ